MPEDDQEYYEDDNNNHDQQQEPYEQAPDQHKYELPSDNNTNNSVINIACD
jgi:hypothetical protein